MNTGRRPSDSRSSPPSWQSSDDLHTREIQSSSTQDSSQISRTSPPLRVDIPPPPQNYGPSNLYYPSGTASADTPALSQDQEFDFSEGVIGEEIFDDVNLTALEKIYLFARSQAVFHRVFISRSLPSFLHEVPPSEAVEYVLPLLNSLGTDPDESVKEAFVTHLVPTMWWFYTHTRLVEDESLIPQPAPQAEDSGNDGLDSQTESQAPNTTSEEDECPLIPVQTFTPLLGHLLLSSNQTVAEAARTAIVEFLRRLRDSPEPESTEPIISSTPAGQSETPMTRDWSFGTMGKNERNMLEKELLYGVVIGMARLDQPDDVVEGENLGQTGEVGDTAKGPNVSDSEEQIAGGIVDSGEGLIDDDDEWLGPPVHQKTSETNVQPAIEHKHPPTSDSTISGQEPEGVETTSETASTTLDPSRYSPAAQSPPIPDPGFSASPAHTPSPTLTSTTAMPSATQRLSSPLSDVEIDSPSTNSPPVPQSSSSKSSSAVPTPVSPTLHVIPLPVSESVVTTPITASPPATTSMTTTSSSNTLLVTALKKRLAMHQEEDLVSKEIQNPMPSSPVLHLETLPPPVVSTDNGAVKMLEGTVTPSVLEVTPPFVVMPIDTDPKDVVGQDQTTNSNEKVPIVQVDLSPSMPSVPMESRSTPHDSRTGKPFTFPSTSRNNSSNSGTPIQTPLASQPTSPADSPFSVPQQSFGGGLKGGSGGGDSSGSGSGTPKADSPEDSITPKREKRRPMEEVVAEVFQSLQPSGIGLEVEPDGVQNDDNDMTPKPEDMKLSSKAAEIAESSEGPSPDDSGRGSISSSASRPPPLTSDSSSTVASASSSGSNTTVDTPEGSDGSGIIGGTLDVYSPLGSGGSDSIAPTSITRRFGPHDPRSGSSAKGKERMHGERITEDLRPLQDSIQEESVVDLTSPPFLAASGGHTPNGPVDVPRIVEGTSYLQPFVNVLPSITAPPYPDVFSSSTSTSKPVLPSSDFSFPPLPPPSLSPSSSTKKAHPSTPPSIGPIKSLSSAGSSDDNDTESPTSSPRAAMKGKKKQRRSQGRRSSSAAQTPNRYTFAAAAANMKRRNSTDGGMGFLPMGGLKSRLSDTEVAGVGLSRRRSWSSEGTRAIGESTEEDLEGILDKGSSPPRSIKSPIPSFMRSPMMKAVSPPVSPPPLVDRASVTAAGSSSFTRAKSPIPLLSRIGRGDTSEVLIEEEEDDMSDVERDEDIDRVASRFHSDDPGSGASPKDGEDQEEESDPFSSFVTSKHVAYSVIPPSATMGAQSSESRRMENAPTSASEELVATSSQPAISSYPSNDQDVASASVPAVTRQVTDLPVIVSSPDKTPQEMPDMDNAETPPRTPQRSGGFHMPSLPIVSPHTGLEEDPAWSVFTITQTDPSYFSDIPRTSTKDLFDPEELELPTNDSASAEATMEEAVDQTTPEAGIHVKSSPQLEEFPMEPQDSQNAEGVLEISQSGEQPLSPHKASMGSPLDALQPDVELEELRPENRLPYVEGYIPELVHDDGTRTTEEDHIDGSTVVGSEEGAVGRVASMSLIACIAAAGVLNTETTQAFSTEVFRVGRDPVYWVRREAAYALGALAKVAPFDLVFSTLLNLYDILTKDRVWHVRQSALFALPGILSRLPASQRKHLALSQTALLTKDPSRSVRSGVLEIMGEVIYSFRDDEGGPPTELVDLFIGRGENNGKPETENPPESNWNEAADGPTWDLPETPFATRKPVERPARPPSFHSIFEDNSDSGSSSDSARELFGSRSSFLTGANQYSRDPERSLICAFNFPAVVLATGKDRWAELKVYYHVLTQSHVVKVRRTLGASLGEIARIIGPENTHQDLLPVWWDALHDSDAEVRMKVIKSLDTFVAALSLEDRVKVGKQLDTLWTQTLYGWKEREALAGLLGSLANSLAQADDFDSARLLAMRAIIDTVAAVREAAITAFPKLLKELSPNNQALDLAYADLYSLASTDIFRRRTAFTSACTALLVADHAHRLVNSDEFWSCLRSLSDDAVIDVRIGLARLVATLCERLYPDVYARPQAIADLIRKLYRDPSIDVKSYVSHLIHTPSSPLTAVSSSSSGQLFATFSRPPTAPSLLTDEMDDYEGDDDPAMDMDLENVDSTAQRQLPVEGSEPTNV